MTLDSVVVDDLGGVPSDRLMAEICELAGHMWAAECRWLLMVGELDRRESWAEWGIHSCAHWLSWRCGVALGAAREKVRVARRLSELPLITAAFSKGELSYAKVRALTRVANDANEPALVDIARLATASQLERIVRTYRRTQVDAELAEANHRHEGRNVSWHWDEDGSLVLSARLAPEDGAVLLEALAAGRSIELPPQSRAKDVSAETRRSAPSSADALVGMARLALSAVDKDDRGDAPYQVVVHVDEPVLVSDEADGRCHLEDGPRLPPETLRRLACDAAVVVMADGADAGTPLDVGRKTRTIPPAIRRALRSRDGGCRFPGCSNRRFVDGHHIIHWEHGGRTELANLVQMCRRHHRLVHEFGYGLTISKPGVFVFTRPDGQVILDVPSADGATGPSLQDRNHDQGLTIDPGTCRSIAEGERFDLSMTIDAVLCQEMRRRGRSWGVPQGATPNDQQPMHDWLIAAVPEFGPQLEEHIALHDKVVPDALVDTFGEFVLDAHRAGKQSVVTRCLNLLDTAAQSLDDTMDDSDAAKLVRSFVYTVGPWEPDTRKFVATWPPALRRYSDAMITG